MMARCFHLLGWAYGHARTAGRLILASALVMLYLSVFLVAIKAQNSVAGEGRVARAAQVTGTTSYHYCQFDGPAKVDNYALASSVVPGRCHDSGVSSKQPKPKQWRTIDGLYLGVIKEVQQVEDNVYGILDIAEAAKPKVSTPELAAQQLSQLRELANSKKLRWGIHCREDASDPDRLFLAYAEPRSMPKLAMYIEEGAQPQWLLPAPSQEAAVRLLYRAIQRAPNYYPEHKPTKKHKPCPAPLEGE